MSEIEPEALKALLQQTMELGQLLHSIADKDPEGMPSVIACNAFRNWVEAAGPYSTEPRYFADVYENYDAPGRCNKDLFDVFELLDPFLELPYEEEEDEQPIESKPRTFIPLPLG